MTEIIEAAKLLKSVLKANNIYYLLEELDSFNFDIYFCPKVIYSHRTSWVADALHIFFYVKNESNYSIESFSYPVREQFDFNTRVLMQSNGEYKYLYINPIEIGKDSEITLEHWLEYYPHIYYKNSRIYSKIDQKELIKTYKLLSFE